CEGDEDLKREIQLLLDKDSGTTVLDRPAWEVLSKSSVKQLAEGTRSSHYRNDVRSFPNESRMKSPRAPWWMYVIAASFIGLQAFIPYLYIWGPADIQDLQARFESGAMLIRAIEPNSELSDAGVHPGDRVIAID